MAAGHSVEVAAEVAIEWSPARHAPSRRQTKRAGHGQMLHDSDSRGRRVPRRLGCSDGVTVKQSICFAKIEHLLFAVAKLSQNAIRFDPLWVPS